MTLGDVLKSPSVQPDTIVTVQLAVVGTAESMKAANEENMVELDIWNRRVDSYTWNPKKGLVISLA